MEAWLVAIGAVVALGITSAAAIRARRRIARIADAAGIDPTDDPVAAVRALRERADRLDAARSVERERHDALVESLAQGVLDVDGDFVIVAANGAAHGLMGREPRTLVGRTLIEAFLDTQVETTARTALETGSATGEFALAGADGTRLVVRARRAPPVGLWLVLEDVSELRRLQQIRAEFIDNLSHELRTPLTTVSLLAETLTREAEAAGDAVPPRMRDRIDKIEVETGHLVQMVNELLDLSRIESGGALGVVDILDVGQIATESTERLRLFADRQGVTLRVEVAEPLPPVRGDAARLGQVIVNLLHNAVKFDPHDEVLLDILLEKAALGKAPAFYVRVSDRGVGVPDADKPHLFERGFRPSNAPARRADAIAPPGSGIGLSLCKFIVQRAGGEITVENRIPGDATQGSAFVILLPAA